MAEKAPEQSYLRDLVYGGIDGAVTTFAIVAGVAGAGLSPFVIVALGLANVFADGFSMAAGNYSGTKAEAENQARLRQVTRVQIATDPEGERRALRRMLIDRGLSGETLEGAVTQIAAQPEAWIDLVLDSRYGVTALDPSPMRAALATFGAFLVAGMVPLLPFLAGIADAFPISVGLTLASFFAIGTLRARWSLKPWWKAGGETLAIGALAAGIAFGVGTLFTV